MYATPLGASVAPHFSHTPFSSSPIFCFYSLRAPQIVQRRSCRLDGSVFSVWRRATLCTLAVFLGGTSMFKSISCFIAIALLVALQITGSIAGDAEWDRTAL